MRALKIIGGVLAALVAIVVLGVIALVLWVDPNDYRDDIEQLVERHTGRPLEIGGSMDLDVFPWLALRVEDVRLGNPPQFGEEPFLTVARANVGVKLLPLLRRNLEVSRVAVEGLSVTLIGRGEGVNNWSDLGGSDEEEPAAEGEAPQTRIAGIDVTGATIVYRDEAEGSVLRLSELELHTGAIGGGAPVDATASFAFDQGEPQPLARVKLKTIAHLPEGASHVELRDLSADAEWFGAPEEAGGTAGRSSEALPISVRAESLVLDWEAETLSPTSLELRVGSVPLTVTAQGEKLFSERVVTGEISIPRMSLRKALPELGVELPETADPSVLTKFELKGSYRLTETALRLPQLDLLLDDTRVRGSAGIEDLEKMALAFDLNVDAINVDRYLGPEKEEASKGGAAQAEEPTELPLDALRELNAKGSLAIGRAVLAGLEFSDIRLPLSASGGLVRVGPTQARLFGGSYGGNIVLDARQAQARLSLDERARDIDIGALMKAAFETDRVSGRGDASAVLKAVGNTDAAILASLSGRIEANVREGAFNGVDLLYELRRAYALWKREPIPARAGGEPRTAFRTLSGSAVLDQGVMRNDDLRVETDILRASGKGTIDLNSKAIDYRLVAEVYRLPSEGAGAEMTDLKAAEIPITITGTLDDMSVRPDLASLVKERVRKEVTERVEEKKEELKKKLGDRLKDLLNR